MYSVAFAVMTPVLYCILLLSLLTQVISLAVPTDSTSEDPDATLADQCSSYVEELSSFPYTDPLCWLSRLQCASTAIATAPTHGQYGIFKTSIDLSGAAPKCVRIQTLQIRSILSLYNLRFLYSPRYTRGKFYQKKRLMEYMVDCGVGNYALLYVDDFELEPKCSGKCVDFVYIDNGPAGIIEACGNDVSNLDFKFINESQFKVTFRSSDTMNYRGFAISAICFPYMPSQNNKRHSRCPVQYDLSLTKQDKLDISTMMTSVFRYLESTPEYQDLGVDDESEWYDRCYSDRKLRMLNSDEKEQLFLSAVDLAEHHVQNNCNPILSAVASSTKYSLSRVLPTSIPSDLVATRRLRPGQYEE